MQITKRKAVGAIMAAGMLTAPAAADEIFTTGTPTPGFLGFYGFDISQDQSVAIAFTADQDYALDQVGMWMMSNDFANPGAEYTVSLRADAGGGGSLTTPDSMIIETWDVATGATGWNPVLDVLDSVLHPTLSAGTTYWIVAESDAPGGLDPVWVAASQSTPVWNAIMNSANPNPTEWYAGYGQGVPGMVINGSPVPTPAGAAVLALGGLVGTRRRRR